MDQITITPQAKTIEEFCVAWRFSRSFFYKLKQQRRAPQLTYLGSKPLITNQAEAEWARERSAAPAPPRQNRRKRKASHNQLKPDVETAPG
jgi:hypothetical protein